MARTPGKAEQLAAQIKALSESLASEGASILPPADARRVRKTVGEVYERLQQVMQSLDPVSHAGFMFDPSNPEVVGRIVGITMIAQDRKPLAALGPFYGSGVYALYYRGDFPEYQPISGVEHPIYVGKADPAQPWSKTAVEQGAKISGRLADHKKSIAGAPSLRVEDFDYRALVVQTGWQTAAESYLINLFRPIWNKEVKIAQGLGKHGDASTTRAHPQSPWDTLHPGREWARDAAARDTTGSTSLSDRIAAHFVEYPPVLTVDEILRRFLDEMRKL